MKFLLKCAMVLAAMVPPHHAAAQSPQRLPEIPLEQLTPEQRKWVDSVSAPPRGANFK